MEINRYIDYTLLKPEANLDSLLLLCREAIENNYHSVCVCPWMVKTASQRLKGTETNVCSVVGFPLGYNLTETKVSETIQLIKNGAEEIDMVANLSAFHSREFALVKADIKAAYEVCSGNGFPLKVILETGTLNFEQIRQLCVICAEVGVDFVKTSTGFATIHAELDKVKFMHEILPHRMGIKASGGIRTYEDALKFLSAGAKRIGTSSQIKNVVF